MRSKNKFYCLTLIVFILFYLVPNGKGFECNLINFEIDKDLYYSNETITMNASWELSFNPLIELAFIQFFLFDEFNYFLWNSTRYYQTGENSWTIPVLSLNLSFSKNITTICAKCNYYWLDTSSGNSFQETLSTIEIKIHKRPISCNLIDFKENIKLGEDLWIQAQFVSTLLVTNLSISFKILKNTQEIYNATYTTNEIGVIETIISRTLFTSYGVGEYILNFSLKNSKFYCDYAFERVLTVESEEEPIKKTKTEKESHLLEILILTVGALISIGIATFFYAKRKRKPQPLTKNTFRY